jgi:hypothetical protein
MQKDFLTVGEIAAQYHEPLWKVRQIVDALDTPVPRAGLYRLIPRELVAVVAARLQGTSQGELQA